VWDVETARRVATLRGHTGAIWEIVYSPDGDMIATAGDDGTARLWDATGGEEIFVLRGHDQSVLSIAFSPDSKQVATGGTDGTVRLWNIQTGSLEAILPETVGTEVLSWNVAEARQAGVIHHQMKVIDWVLDVSYSPTGDQLVAANTDGSVDIYITDTDKLIEIAWSQVTRDLSCEERVQFLHEDLGCSLETATLFPALTSTPAP
jgi:WD40 repeat protein